MFVGAQSVLCSRAVRLIKRIECFPRFAPRGSDERLAVQIYQRELSPRRCPDTADVVFDEDDSQQSLVTVFTPAPPSDGGSL